MHTGLAQVLDAQGEYRAAAEHLSRANSLKLAYDRLCGQGYDPAIHEQSVTDLIETFSPACFERLKGFGIESERPVFIFGLPRSGTTLTEQILAGHSQVFGAGELNLAHAAFESLPQVTLQRASVVECVRSLDRESVEQMARGHLARLAELDDCAPRIVDKMPENYRFLGLLATLFPQAKLIHCRRDLRDVAVSCWMTNFRNLTWTCCHEHIAARFHAYERLMEHWRQVLPVPMLEVNYEETVVDLEGTARRLIEWCGLSW